MLGAKTGSAQPSADPTDAERTIRALWESADPWLPPAGIHLTFRIQHPATMSSEELAAAEARLAPFPEHPDHRTLADERRRQDRGPDAQARAIWYLDDQHFRSNLDSPATESIGDVVRTPEYAWGMGTQALKIIDPNAPSPPSGDLSFAAGETTSILRRLRIGGLRSHRGLELTTLEVDGTRARVVAQTPEGTRWAYDLALLAGTGRWVVERSTLEHFARSPERSGGWTSFEGWHVRDDLPGAPVLPTRLEQRNERGVVEQIWDQIEARPLDQAEFSRVAAIPTFDGQDAVRGAVTFTVAHDYRPSAGVRMELVEGGGVISAPIPAADMGAAPPAGWRVLGWGVAAALAAALVVLKVWRSRVAGRPKS